MEIWQFLSQNWHQTLNLAGQHAWVVSVTVIIAMATGIPIGIWITFNDKAADMVLYIAGIIMTIPSIALFGIMIP
ncbi:MAG: choline ABC transporter permease, partial [Desulfatirhabdiaceae bacterium]